MALVSIQHVLVDNYAGADGMLAGAAVALSDLNGVPTVVPGVRTSGAPTGEFFGILGDDTTNQGNTQAIVDPVALGNYSHSDSDGINMPDYYGPEFVSRPARRLGDYLDERITNINNWTDAPAHPKRGVTVYRGSGRFKTDQFVPDAETSAAAADAGGVPTWEIGDSVTVGADGNDGLFIKLADAAHGTAVATVVSTPAETGLLEIALV